MTADITLTRLNVTFPRAVGIDYLSTAQSLVMSVNYGSTATHVFETLDAAGNQQVFAEDAVNYTEEVKIAAVPAGNPQFPAGDVFAGNGHPGQIVRITGGGATVIDPWVTLPNENGLIRGSLYVDRTGVFTYDLIAVTTAGGVWRVGANAQLQPVVRSKVATIVSGGSPVHLEGVVTLPNDASKYGANWAGKILAGAEQLNRFYYIGANGVYNFTPILADDGMWVAPEDIDVITPNQNLYAVEYGDNDDDNYRAGAIMKAGAAQFTGMESDLLVSVEWGNGQEHTPGGLYRVWWNNLTSAYQATRLASPESGTHFEHATFAPITITPPPPVVSITAPEPAEIYEEGGQGSYADLTFSRTGDWGVPLAVRFTLPAGAGRATFLEDYGLNPALTPDGGGNFRVTIPSFSGSYGLKVGAQPDSFLEGQEIVRAAIQSETAYTVDPLAAAAELAILDGEDVHPQPYIYNLIAVTPTSGDYYYNWSEAYAINNENIVTGFFNPPPNYGQWTPHAIRWVSGAPLTDLNPGSAWYTWGYGINADGWIVGKAQSTSGGDYACLWNPANNQMSYYTPLQTGTYGNEARAVNSSGVVVGSGKNTQGVVQAIQWSTGIPLYSLSIQYRSTRVSNAYGVSESGRVVGRSRGDFSSTVFHGFRTQPDLEIQPTDDLGTGTGIDTDSSEALGINSLDEAVGVTHFNTTAGKRSHAFFKTVYQGKNLGFLDLTPDKYSSRATAINNQGDVVGTYVQASGGTSKGFVRYNDGTFGDLWALTNPTQRAIWTFTTPLAINDNGWIVGVGNVNTYYGRGFILVPVY